jgi:hypothetical protein
MGATGGGFKLDPELALRAELALKPELALKLERRIGKPNLSFEFMAFVFLWWDGEPGNSLR